MKLLTKLTGIAALALALGTQGALAETWRMATKMPVDSPEGKVFAKFAELTDKYTDGKLKITVYPNEQLGKEDAVLEQLQAGIVNIYAEGFGYMRKWAPELSWTSPSFLFDDYDHWVRFMNSDLVKGWFAKAAKVSGVGPLGDPTAVLRGPYRVMVSNVPVKSLDDVQGLKLRMHPDKLAIATWSYLGADVITLPWTEVYQAIQKGIVQSVNSPVALVQSMRFNEVAPYIEEHDEYWQSIGFMMNLAAYDKLPQDEKDGLLKAYNEAAAYSQVVMGQVADDSLKQMEANGTTFIKLDTKPFVDKMKGFYDKMAADGELPEGMMKTVDETRKASQ